MFSGWFRSWYHWFFFQLITFDFKISPLMDLEGHVNYEYCILIESLWCLLSECTELIQQQGCKEMHIGRKSRSWYILLNKPLRECKSHSLRSPSLPSSPASRPCSTLAGPARQVFPGLTLSLWRGRSKDSRVFGQCLTPQRWRVWGKTGLPRTVGKKSACRSFVVLKILFSYIKLWS